MGPMSEACAMGQDHITQWLKDTVPRMTIPRRNCVSERFTTIDEELYVKGRGISRDLIETSHPLPEHVDDYFSDGAYQFSQMGDIPYSMGPTTYSGRSSPDHGQSDVSQSMLSISIGGNTGNTTERSSICSLGEDDFEREATREVRAMFREIDSALFEGETGPPQLAGECSEWVSVFPHLRILGRQIVSPQDVGYEFIEGDSTPRNTGNVLMDVTEQDISHSHAVHELSVMGQHVQAYQAPLDMLSSRLTETPFEEEIIEQDGLVEDIIAIDYRSIEDDSRSVHTNHNRRRPRGLPPVTPQAVVKDNIAGAAFDYLWSESISWLRPMVKHYADNVVLDQDDIMKQQGHDVTGNDDFHVCSSPRDHQYGPSRESSMYSRLGIPKSLPPGILVPNPPDGLNKLDGVLTISTKALQSREKSILGEVVESTLDRSLAMLRPSNRPMSSIKILEQNRPMSVKLDQTRLNSARNMKTRGRLAPIERVKTPSVEDERAPKLTNEGVRGRGITTINERLSSPPSPFSRIGALPPIGLDLDLQAGILPRKKFSQRASSAVHNDKEARIHIKEREKTVLGVPQENRPSTTHALYRSETPLGLGGRRSSTPVGFNTLRLQHGTQLALAAPSTNVNLNVTGNSINPQMDADIDLDDSDVNFDDITSQRWGASNLHPQIRRTKQQHSVVR